MKSFKMKATKKYWKKILKLIINLKKTLQSKKTTRQKILNKQTVKSNRLFKVKKKLFQKIQSAFNLNNAAKQKFQANIMSSKIFKNQNQTMLIILKN